MRKESFCFDKPIPVFSIHILKESNLFVNCGRAVEVGHQQHQRNAFIPVQGVLWAEGSSSVHLWKLLNLTLLNPTLGPSSPTSDNNMCVWGGGQYVSRNALNPYEFVKSAALNVFLCSWVMAFFCQLESRPCRRVLSCVIRFKKIFDFLLTGPVNWWIELSSNSPTIPCHMKMTHIRILLLLLVLQFIPLSFLPPHHPPPSTCLPATNFTEAFSFLYPDLLNDPSIPQSWAIVIAHSVIPVFLLLGINFTIVLPFGI